MKKNRRQFISQMGIAAAAITGLSALTDQPSSDIKKPGFIHHVFFWLKDPDNNTDRDKLVEGLRALARVKTIRSFHIGKPANTNREVIERGYAVSWLTYFDNEADQASYQEDPIHLNFVKQCSMLWSKVIVYDTVNL